MRVVTRALSMASMVSARPGPVPGAGGNCAQIGAAVARINIAKIAQWKSCFMTPRKRKISLVAGRWSLVTRWREGPLSHFPCPNQKCKHAEGDCEQAPFAEGAGLPEKPDPGEGGEHGGQRIHPHFERQFLRGPAFAEKHYAHSLTNELDKQTHGEKGHNHSPQF